jgi:hypothetical protein
MSRYYLYALFSVVAVFTCLQAAHAQVITDSVLLKQAFKDNDKAAVDSMLDSWYAQSVIKKHGSSGNDTIEFVYDIYTRFAKDYIHKMMAGKKGIPVNGNYVFIQDKIHYLFMDSLSFEDLHYYLNSIFEHYGLLSYRDSIRTYILKTIANSHEGGTVKAIDPFYPGLKEVFYDHGHDPKPIYIRDNNHLNTLIHFLGYKVLTRHFTNYDTTNIVELEKRKRFLNNSLHFDSNKFLSHFERVFTPDVLNILVDSKMRYAMVEYAGSEGAVDLAFYPLKLINSGSGTPLSWPFFAE